MEKYSSLYELIGYGNILNNIDLLKLKGAKIRLSDIDASVKNAIVYTENNHDFALVYEAPKKSHHKFVYISLSPSLLGKYPDRADGYVLARPPGYMFIHEYDSKKTSHFPSLTKNYSLIREEFDKVHNGALPKVETDSFAVDKVYSSSRLPEFISIRATEIPYSNPIYANIKRQKVVSDEDRIRINAKFQLGEFSSEEQNILNSKSSFEDSKDIRSDNISDIVDCGFIDEKESSNYFLGADFKSPFQGLLDFFKFKK